jgi:hypothetical protein
MDWNRHHVKGLGTGVAALAAGLLLGVSACSTGSSSSHDSVVPVTTSASGAAPVSTATTSGSGSGGAGSVDENVVLDDCNHVGIVEPSSYTPACADGGYVLNSIQWATWTADQATGTAMAAVNLCQPTCAAGAKGNYPVSIVFSGSVTDSGNPNASTYKTLTATYAQAQPPGAGASRTFQVGPNG